MDCSQVARKLFEYLDKELAQEDTSNLEKHLEECRACFDHVEFERMLREHLRKITHHRCPEKLKQKIKAIIEKF